MRAAFTILLMSVLFLTKIDSIKCQNQISPRNIVASVLQDVLSPTNTEKAIQMIKMASAGTNRKMAVPEVAMPAQNYVQRGREMPARILTNEMQLPVRMANEYQLPVRMANEIQLPVRVPNEMGPNIVVNQAPVRTVMPNEFIIQGRPVNEMPRFVVKEMGMPMQRMVVPEKRISLPVIDTFTRSMSQNLPIMNYLQEDALSRLPIAMANPFLPAASPISAIAPPTLASLPLPTQARGHFLRKIPIPPPSL